MAEALDELNQSLKDIHSKAIKARDAKDFSQVEKLRLERLQILQASRAESPWTAGYKAIMEADKLIKRMNYKAASDKLKEAWEAFEAPQRGEYVFGDVAMKLFETTQATLAVYPDSTTVTGISNKKLREAVQLAADEDPCQVEALAADAFLTVPNPEESFQPAELRPSLRLRNKRLIDISYSKDRDEPLLPWHAPAEFLKSESSSFVLQDLDYYEHFLDPERRLRGRDRHGEEFNVVMGGALLVIAADGEGPKRPCVAEYLPEEHRWQRLRPMILSVGPLAVQSSDWRLDKAALLKNISTVIEDADDERQRVLVQRIVDTATGLKNERRVKADIRVILGWMKKPPLGKGTSLTDILARITQGYRTYAARNPEDVEGALASESKVQAISDEWQKFSELRNDVVGKLLDAPAAPGSPPNIPPASVDFNTAGVLDRFLKFLESDDLAEIEAAVGNSRAEEAAGQKPNQPDADEDTKPKKPAAQDKDDAEKPPTPQDAEGETPDAENDAEENTESKKPPAKGAKTKKPTGRNRLYGRELRMQLVEQVDYYDLLVMFYEMRQTYEKQIQQTIDSPPTPSRPDSRKEANEQQRDKRRNQAVSLCKRGLAAYASVRDKTWKTIAEKAADGTSIQREYFALTLDGLRDTKDAMASISLALTQLGDDSSYARFVDRFYRKCDLLERPAGLETDLVKSSQGDAKRIHAWTIGQTRWTIYEFPKGVRNSKLADWIDYSRRVSFDIADLEEAAKALSGKEKKLPRPRSVPLRVGATTEFNNPLVESEQGLPVMPLLKEVKYPLILILLAIDKQTEDDFKPEGFTNPQGPEFLWLEESGARYKATLQTGSESDPELIIAYPGADGHIPLAIPRERFAKTRHLRDRRGNRIVHDDTSGKSDSDSRFFKITSESGEELTDRSVNYAKQDWIDLDRNIINSFLPDLMLHGPSLPAWRLYRQEFERKAAAPDWKWTVPRWAYTIGPDSQ